MERTIYSLAIILLLVSYKEEKRNAVIEFHQTKTNEKEIEKTITSTGYKVTDKKETE